MQSLLLRLLLLLLLPPPPPRRRRAVTLALGCANHAVPPAAPFLMLQAGIVPEVLPELKTPAHPTRLSGLHATLSTASAAPAGGHRAGGASGAEDAAAHPAHLGRPVHPAGAAVSARSRAHPWGWAWHPSSAWLVGAGPGVGPGLAPGSGLGRPRGGAGGRTWGRSKGRPKGHPRGRPKGRPKGRSWGRPGGRSWGRPGGRSWGRPGGQAGVGPGFVPGPQRCEKCRWCSCCELRHALSTSSLCLGASPSTSYQRRDVCECLRGACLSCFISSAPARPRCSVQHQHEPLPLLPLPLQSLTSPGSLALPAAPTQVSSCRCHCICSPPSCSLPSLQHQHQLPAVGRGTQDVGPHRQPLPRLHTPGGIPCYFTCSTS